MGVVWGAEGAQECQVLLKLGQGRTVSKGLLDLACISVLGSHRHHLRDIEHARERGPPGPRARRGVTGGHIMHPATAHCQSEQQLQLRIRVLRRAGQRRVIRTMPPSGPAELAPPVVVPRASIPTAGSWRSGSRAVRSPVSPAWHGLGPRPRPGVRKTTQSKPARTRTLAAKTPSAPPPAMPASRMTGAPRSRHGDRCQPPRPDPMAGPRARLGSQ